MSKKVIKWAFVLLILYNLLRAIFIVVELMRGPNIASPFIGASGGVINNYEDSGTFYRAHILQHLDR